MIQMVSREDGKVHPSRHRRDSPAKLWTATRTFDDRGNQSAPMQQRLCSHRSPICQQVRFWQLAAAHAYGHDQVERRSRGGGQQVVMETLGSSQVFLALISTSHVLPATSAECQAQALQKRGCSDHFLIRTDPFLAATAFSSLF